MELRSAPRLLVLAAIVTGLSGVAACGPAATTTTSPATSAPTVADSSPPPTLPSAEPSASGGGSGSGGGTVTGGTGVCKASTMTEAVYGGGAAAGTGYTGIVLTNKASTSCKVSGYPVLTFIDAGGRAYDVPFEHNLGAPTVFALAAGGKAYFTVAHADGPMNDDMKKAPCDPAAAGVRISFSTNGSDAVTDKGPWPACGFVNVGPFTTKPDSTLEH